MIGENCLFLYHCEIIRPADICIEASILIPTPSRVSKEDLSLLSAFGFKVARSSFSPLSSRFIFVLALFQSTRTLALSLVAVPLGQFTSVTRNALAEGNNRAIGNRQRGPDYLEAWKRVSMGLTDRRKTAKNLADSLKK